MPIASAITSALSMLEGDAVRSTAAQARYIVWDIRDPGMLAANRRERLANIDSAKLSIWNALLESRQPVMIVHPESPQEYEVAGEWASRGDRTWLLPSGFDPHEPSTRPWLAVGGWTVYVAPALITSWPDMFRTTAAEAGDWAARHAVSAVISSFYDDTEWRVIVAADT